MHIIKLTSSEDRRTMFINAAQVVRFYGVSPGGTFILMSGDHNIFVVESPEQVAAKLEARV